MVGRYRSPKGISYGGWHDYEPEDIDYDNFLQNRVHKESINILLHRPGIGKTYSTLKFLKEKGAKDKEFKFFYFTDRHNAILEHTKDWKEGTYSHWKGFNRICTKSWMKSYYKYHLRAKDICAICGECDKYTSQFEDTSRVFAPFNYLLSNDFKDNPPDIIILDENIKQFNSYSAEFDKAETLFEKMGKDDLVQLVKQKDCKTLSNKIDINKFSKEYKGFILELAKKRGKNKDILKLIEEFNIFDFYNYVRWESIYNYGLKTYGVPSLYHGAFEAVTKGIPAVFMDATYNHHLFCYLLESYNAETKFMGKKGFTDLMVVFFYDEKKHIKQKSTIYRMHPEHVMPKVSFTVSKNWNHTQKWLTSDMKLIMDIFGRNNVGIITFKALGDFPKALGYNVECYGNLRGLNILENKPVLVIIGSYIPVPPSWHPYFKKDIQEKEGFDELLSKYFLLEVNEDNLYSVRVEAPNIVSSRYDYRLAKAYAYQYDGEIGNLLGTDGDEIVKHPAEALTTLFWYDEIYQAFHRNRGLRYPRIIFAYCWFPEPSASLYATDSAGKITDEPMGNLSLFNHNLRDEFKVDKVQNDKFNEVLNFLSESEYGAGGIIEDIVSDILQNPNPKTKELTPKYKVHKSHKKGEKGGADTIPITKLIEVIRVLKKEAKRIKAE